MARLKLAQRFEVVAGAFRRPGRRVSRFIWSRVAFRAPQDANNNGRMTDSHHQAQTEKCLPLSTLVYFSSTLFYFLRITKAAETSAALVLSQCLSMLSPPVRISGVQPFGSRPWGETSDASRVSPLNAISAALTSRLGCSRLP